MFLCQTLNIVSQYVLIIRYLVARFHAQYFLVEAPGLLLRGLSFVNFRFILSIVDTNLQGHPEAYIPLVLHHSLNKLLVLSAGAAEYIDCISAEG